MKMTGRYKGASFDLDGNLSLTFDISDKFEVIPMLDDLSQIDKLSIEVKKFREKRSLDANGMLWACLGEMAQVLRTDKWSVYLKMLKRYGQFTYMSVRPDAVDKLKELWRECEEVGKAENGNVEMLCYFGSSTYNTQEFSILLDGVISEMREIGLHPPMSKEIERSLELWEKQHSATK